MLVLVAVFLSCISKMIDGKKYVQVLDESNFANIALDKQNDVLVAFFASQCAECKRIAPIYENVARSFRNERHCVLAQVNGDMENEIASRYNVKRYPTFKLFSKRIKQGRKYYGNITSEEKLIGFLNKQCGTSRRKDGGLDNVTGRTTPLDAIAKRFATRKLEREEVLLAAKNLRFTDKSEESNLRIYISIMERILLKGDSYVAKEIKRLEKLLNYSLESLSTLQGNTMSMKRNILYVFRENIARDEL